MTIVECYVYGFPVRCISFLERLKHKPFRIRLTSISWGLSLNYLTRWRDSGLSGAIFSTPWLHKRELRYEDVGRSGGVKIPKIALRDSDTAQPL